MFKLPFISLLLFSLKAPSVQGLKFLIEPDNQYITEGDEGLLHCVFDQLLPSPCYWINDGVTVRVEDRYEYVGDPKTGDCSIRIKHSNYNSDDGMWKCGTLTTSSEAGLGSRLIKVTILVMPQDPLILINNIVNNDSNIFVNDLNNQPPIICMSKFGNPQTRLSWRLNDKYLGDNMNNFYQLNYINNTSWLMLNTRIHLSWHRQQLTCIADHPYYGINQQRIRSATVWIRHQAKNVQVFAQTEVITTARKRTETSHALHCIADGHPPPKYIWQWRYNESDPWQTFRNEQNISVVSQNGQFSCLVLLDSNNRATMRAAKIITIQKNEITNQASIHIISLGIIGAVFLIIITGSTILLIRRNMIPDSRKKNHLHAFNIPTFLPQTKSEFPKTPLPNYLDVASSQFNMEYLDSPYLAPISAKESIASSISTDSSMTDNTIISTKTDQTYIEPIYQEILPEI